MSAAKWHREQAAFSTAYARLGPDDVLSGNAGEVAVHHATAADALDALAVPGVASLLAHLAISLSMQTDTGSRVGSKWMLSDEERASLAALAKIGRGE